MQVFPKHRAARPGQGQQQAGQGLEQPQLAVRGSPGEEAQLGQQLGQLVTPDGLEPLQRLPGLQRRPHRLDHPAEAQLAQALPLPDGEHLAPALGEVTGQAALPHPHLAHQQHQALAQVGLEPGPVPTAGHQGRVLQRARGGGGQQHRVQAALPQVPVEGLGLGRGLHAELGLEQPGVLLVLPQRRRDLAQRGQQAHHRLLLGLLQGVVLEQPLVDGQRVAPL